MKKKSIVFFSSIFLLLIVFLISSNSQQEVNKTIISNYTHTEKDIYYLMNQAIEHMGQYNLKITDVYYDEKKFKDLERILIQNNDGSIESIVLTMTFKTSFFTSNTEFGKNQEYQDYELHFIKNKLNKWELIDGGYS